MDPVEALLPLLRTLARRVRVPCGSILDPDDLVQEACIALARLLPIYRGTTRREFQSFVVARSMGAMRDAVRRVERRRRMACEEMRLEDVRAPAVDHDLSITVRDVMARLRPREAAVVPHWTEGRTVPELAASLGMTGDGVHWWLVKARRTLRRRLRGATPGRARTRTVRSATLGNSTRQD